ncbi:sulfatase-like hydrolase/transferase, partial [bacterium]|nr:sulfatase-like hydrolase/transferase [bacterium]
QLTMNPTAPRHEWMVESNEWKHAVQAYLAANSFVDEMVGMILNSVQKSDAADNTIIILWSDHGFHLGEKLRWGKRTLWEETTRVPLIFSGPGIVTDQQCSRPVGLLDVFPTLLHLAQLPKRTDLEGQSLKQLLENPRSTWNRPALCTFGPNNHSLRGNRYRYTHYADGSEELYDHENDPNEWNNLITGQTTAFESRQIADRMKRWLPNQNAPPVLGSAGSDSPLYGEGTIPLREAMKRGEAQQKAK